MTGIVQTEDQRLAEASAWLVRLQGDESEAAGLELDAWLDASPANLRAYQQVLAAWNAFGASAGEVLDELETMRSHAIRRGASRRWMVGAGGFAVAAALAVTMLPPVLFQARAQGYATATGEHRQVKLADGSVIDINAQSRLTVTLGRHERHVVMPDGEAIFDVAADKDRPFTIQAGNHVVRVVGTQFDVRNRGGELTVTVARGVVQVRPSDARLGQSYVLTSGERLDIAPAGVEQVKMVDPQESFGWRTGRLVYRAEPLASVVADLNRQFPEQIRIEDPELARTPISGVVVVDDQRSVVQRLTLMLPVRSIPSGQGLLLLRK
jgi:transmembrane sensor